MISDISINDCVRICGHYTLPCLVGFSFDDDDGEIILLRFVAGELSYS